jgi:hypothetical protein
VFGVIIGVFMLLAIAVGVVSTVITYDWGSFFDGDNWSPSDGGGSDYSEYDCVNPRAC